MPLDYSGMSQGSTAEPPHRGRPFELSQPAQLRGWKLLIFWPLAYLLRCYLKTLRVSLSAEDLSKLKQSGTGRTLVKWHSYSLVTPRVLKKLFRPQETAALISASLQGANQSRFYECYGLQIERGSTSRRGLHALRKLMTWQKQGYDVLISPDGPSGPLHTFRGGPLLLAEKSGKALVMFSVSCRFAFRANTWDRHLIPLPFSRLNVRIQVIDDVSSELSGSRESMTQQLREKLLEITSEARSST